MTKLNSYLTFDGTCEKAFNLYKSVFGGEFTGIMKFGDVPDMPVPYEAKERIMHIALPVGNDLLMGSDTMPGKPFTQGNNNHISISLESREEADRLFAGLSEGGEIIVPMEQQFWGDYYGNLKDKYGVYWMINCNNQNQ